MDTCLITGLLPACIHTASGGQRRFRALREQNSDLVVGQLPTSPPRHAGREGGGLSPHDRAITRPAGRLLVRRAHVLEKEPYHFAGRVGSFGIGIRPAWIAAKPCMPSAVYQPMLDNDLAR